MEISGYGDWIVGVRGDISKKHFAGEVVDNRIVFEPSREQELWERIYAISDEEGHSGMVFGTAKDEV